MNKPGFEDVQLCSVLGNPDKGWLVVLGFNPIKNHSDLRVRIKIKFLK